MTKIYGLIGFPLGHSFSKRYFTEKFEKENIPASYQNFEIEDINDFPDILDQHPSLSGLSVTSPHKKNVIPFLNELSEEAERLQAVNCIKISRINGKIRTKGYNTDVFGFRESLSPLISQKKSVKALILGTGGAARAVAEALRQLHIEYKFVSRKSQVDNLSYSQINQSLLADYQLIINATPLGMHPFEDKFPQLPYPDLTKNHIVFDLIYNPEKSLFLKKAEQQGAKIKNGLEMLHQQAEKAWEIFVSVK